MYFQREKSNSRFPIFLLKLITPDMSWCQSTNSNHKEIIMMKSFCLTCSCLFLTDGETFSFVFTILILFFHLFTSYRTSLNRKKEKETKAFLVPQVSCGTRVSTYITLKTAIKRFEFTVECIKLWLEKIPIHFMLIEKRLSGSCWYKKNTKKRWDEAINFLRYQICIIPLTSLCYCFLTLEVYFTPKRFSSSPIENIFLFVYIFTLTFIPSYYPIKFDYKHFDANKLFSKLLICQ